MLPEFIIIGAMKGGTTSLYNYLASHPDLQASSMKETNFFGKPEQFAKGLEWYESLWDENKRVVFEASPNYTKRHIFPSVPERMQSILPRVKLIYLVRDPIERIVSHYIHNYANVRESRSISEALQDPKNNNYVLTSKYFYQLQAYLQYYSKEQILVVQSEEMKNEPAKVFGEVCSFLNLSGQYDKAIFQRQFHESRVKMRNSSAERWMTKYMGSPPFGRFGKYVVKRLRRPIQKPVLSPEDREALSAEIAPDIQQLREFTGKSFSDWSV